MKGASCTTSNICLAGGEWDTPVINHPEVAILGVGRIAEKPIVRDGEIVEASVLALLLSLRLQNRSTELQQNAMNESY